MQWVTRRRPKIDRLACPWLIRRFIDGDAEFLFVSPDDVRAVANATGAIPFDVPGVELAPPPGRCSFDVLLTKYRLEEGALHRIADIVRAADNDNAARPFRARGGIAEAAGLRAISFGLAGTIRDDQERVEQGLILYDALYRWVRTAPRPRPERGLRLWLALRRDRARLSEMPEYLLRDMGLTGDDVRGWK
jgi:hypothetical protein